MIRREKGSRAKDKHDREEKEGVVAATSEK